jgi:hypothetical protein
VIVDVSRVALVANTELGRGLVLGEGESAVEIAPSVIEELPERGGGSPFDVSTPFAAFFLFLCLKAGLPLLTAVAGASTYWVICTLTRLATAASRPGWPVGSPSWIVRKESGELLLRTARLGSLPEAPLDRRVRVRIERVWARSGTRVQVGLDVEEVAFATSAVRRWKFVGLRPAALFTRDMPEGESVRIYEEMVAYGRQVAATLDIPFSEDR